MVFQELNWGYKILIKEMISKLSPSEKKVAEYIMANPEESLKLSVEQLSKACGTSGATVVRFCKTMGLNSFQNLKLRICSDLNKENDLFYTDIVPDEKKEVIVKKITDNNIKAIVDTSNTIDMNELEKAVEAIKKADRIVFFGVGASYIVTEDAAQKFLRIGKNCFSPSETQLAAAIVGTLKENDLVFGVSFSGETEEVLGILNLARNKNLKTISLTQLGKSKVANAGDIKLFTAPSIEAPLRSAATSSRMAQLHVIDILFMCAAASDFDETINSLEKTKESIRSLKNMTYKKIK